MHNKRAIFDAAARAQICSITLLNDVYRLLPKRFRSKIDRPPLATVHEDKQTIYQIGMKRVLFPSNPHEVV